MRRGGSFRSIHINQAIRSPLFSYLGILILRSTSMEKALYFVPAFPIYSFQLPCVRSPDRPLQQQVLRAAWRCGSSHCQARQQACVARSRYMTFVRIACIEYKFQHFNLLQWKSAVEAAPPNLTAATGEQEEEVFLPRLCQGQGLRSHSRCRIM